MLSWIEKEQGMDSMCSCASRHGCVRSSVFGPFVDSGARQFATPGGRTSRAQALDQSNASSTASSPPPPPPPSPPAQLRQVKASTTTILQVTFLPNNAARIAVSAAFMIPQRGRLRPSSLASPQSFSLSSHSNLRPIISKRKAYTGNSTSAGVPGAVARPEISRSQREREFLFNSSIS